MLFLQHFRLKHATFSAIFLKFAPMKKVMELVIALLLTVAVPLTAMPLTSSDYDILDMRSGLPEARIRALSQLPDGRVAIATAGTIAIYDGTRFTTYHLQPDDEYSLTSYHGYRHLTCDSTGMVWLRNDGSLYVVDACRKTIIRNIDSLLHARQLTAQQVSQWPTDDDWRSTSEYTIFKDIIDDEISAMLRDSYGGLWIGTSGSGIIYHNPARKQQFRGLAQPFGYERKPAFYSSRASQLSARYAPSATNCTLEGRSLPYAYLGTRNGLLIIDREDRLVATLDEDYGLGTNNVVALLNDRHGDIWAATACGLSRIRTIGTDSFDIVNYGLLDGIDTQGREFRTGAMHSDSSGRISVGFVGGTIIFHPDSVTAPRHTFHFPRSSTSTDSEPSTSLLSYGWWVLLLIIAAAAVGFILLRRRKSIAPKSARKATVTDKTRGEAIASHIAQEAAQEHFSSSELEFLDRLKAVIEQHIGNEDFSVQSLSEMMAMDRTVLYRRMQVLTGMPPSVYIKNIRMDIARRLLLDTDLPVSDIAVKTGFSTTKYFSAAFKESFGMTPNDYRAVRPSNKPVRGSNRPVAFQ